MGGSRSKILREAKGYIGSCRVGESGFAHWFRRFETADRLWTWISRVFRATRWGYDRAAGGR